MCDSTKHNSHLENILHEVNLQLIRDKYTLLKNTAYLKIRVRVCKIRLLKGQIRSYFIFTNHKFFFSIAAPNNPFVKLSSKLIRLFCQKNRLKMSSTSAKLQLTVAILKPDLVRMPYHLELVRSLILKKNFFVVRSKMVNLNRLRAEQFYEEHKGKFFYNRYNL